MTGNWKNFLLICPICLKNLHLNLFVSILAIFFYSRKWDACWSTIYRCIQWSPERQEMVGFNASRFLWISQRIFLLETLFWRAFSEHLQWCETLVSAYNSTTTVRTVWIPWISMDDSQNFGLPFFGTLDYIQTCTPQLRLAKKYAINEKVTIFIWFCSNFQKLIIPWVGQYLKVWTKLDKNCRFFMNGIFFGKSQLGCTGL